ncbi:hypothetical protein RR46_10435 [Papilio xuthus]|uniref:Uncharacterized protein n=1 Tax=Papilio xuthus TaxID=66420 RepID=A0A194PPW6_PAPXU|nr:hypothetical protein RR46_10435 [Papilio xuthus]
MDWQEKAQDRRLWRSLVSEAKTHFGSMLQRRPGLTAFTRTPNPDSSKAAQRAKAAYIGTPTACRTIVGPGTAGETIIEYRKAKAAYIGTPTGCQTIGQPKYRWRDAVELDLREL